MLKHGLTVLLASIALAAHAQIPAPASVAWEIQAVRDGQTIDTFQQRTTVGQTRTDTHRYPSAVPVGCGNAARVVPTERSRAVTVAPLTVDAGANTVSLALDVQETIDDEGAKPADPCVPASPRQIVASHPGLTVGADAWTDWTLVEQHPHSCTACVRTSRRIERHVRRRPSLPFAEPHAAPDELTAVSWNLRAARRLASPRGTRCATGCNRRTPTCISCRKQWRAACRAPCSRPARTDGRRGRRRLALPGSPRSRMRSTGRSRSPNVFAVVAARQCDPVTASARPRRPLGHLRAPFRAARPAGRARDARGRPPGHAVCAHARSAAPDGWMHWIAQDGPLTARARRRLQRLAQRFGRAVRRDRAVRGRDAARRIGPHVPRVSPALALDKMFVRG